MKKRPTEQGAVNSHEPAGASRLHRLALTPCLSISARVAAGRCGLLESHSREIRDQAGRWGSADRAPDLPSAALGAADGAWESCPRWRRRRRGGPVRSSWPRIPSVPLDHSSAARLVFQQPPNAAVTTPGTHALECPRARCPEAGRGLDGLCVAVGAGAGHRPVQQSARLLIGGHRSAAADAGLQVTRQPPSPGGTESLCMTLARVQGPLRQDPGGLTQVPPRIGQPGPPVVPPAGECRFAAAPVPAGAPVRRGAAPRRWATSSA